MNHVSIVSNSSCGTTHSIYIYQNDTGNDVRVKLAGASCKKLKHKTK